MNREESMEHRIPAITGIAMRKCMEIITDMLIPGMQDIITMRIPCILQK